MLPLGLAPFGQRYSTRWIAPSPMSPTTDPPLASHASAVSGGRAASSPELGADDALGCGGAALLLGVEPAAPAQAARL